MLPLPAKYVKNINLMVFNKRNYAYTSCDLNLESSNFLIAYFISSCLKNSTTPVPSLYVSAKQTSPASRIWSFKSCHEPDGGKPDTITLNCDRFDGGPLFLPPSPRPLSLFRLPRKLPGPPPLGNSTRSL